MSLNEFHLVILLLAIIFFVLYKRSVRKHQYWKNKGVLYPKPLPFIGNLLDVITIRFTGGLSLDKLYDKFQTPYFGIYIFHYPYLIIKDPELIKSILIKDFNHFNNRIYFADPKYDSLQANLLVFIKNPEWKFVRSKITPVFSITKIKKMLPLMNEAADEMIEYLEKKSKNGPIQVKDVCAKYATDVLATCAFGIKAHCFKHDNADFMVIGNKVFEPSLRNFIVQTCYVLIPSVVKRFKLQFFDNKVSTFIREMGWDALKKRINSDTKRNDVIDAIKQILENSAPEDKKEFEGDRVIAQVGTFYIAGFETVSAIMSFVLFELCAYPEIQTKLRKEITTVLSKHDIVNHEVLEEMKYLHMVMLEVLRKYPVLQFIDRECTEDYQIPNSNVIIEKGTPVIIPLFGLHYNPLYYPNPKEFNPERFSNDGADGIYNRLFYLPFGKGPRNCVGEKFGLMEIKLGLVRILSKYEIEKCEDTPEHLEFTSRVFLTASKLKINILFKAIS